MTLKLLFLTFLNVILLLQQAFAFFILFYYFFRAFAAEPPQNSEATLTLYPLKAY